MEILGPNGWTDVGMILYVGIHRAKNAFFIFLDLDLGGGETSDFCTDFIPTAFHRARDKSKVAFRGF